MTIYYYFIFLIISFLITIYFNKKIHARTLSIDTIISLVEAVLVSLLLLLTTLEGFTFNLVFFIVSILVFLIFGYFRFIKQNIISSDSDELLEVTKNAFVFINVTIVPFMIALTILRYTNVFVQILGSLVIAAGVYFLSKQLQKAMIKIYDNLKYKIDLSGSRWFIALWIVIAVIALFVAAFDFPDKPILNAINLNNHQPVYGLTSGLDTDIQGNHEKELQDTYVDYTVLINNYGTLYQGTADNVYDEYNTYSLEMLHETPYTTTYIKTNLETQESITKTYNGWHNTDALIIGNDIYLFNKDSLQIEIMDTNLNIVSVHNIQPKEAFWYNNRYDGFSIYATVINDEFYYIQDDINEGLHQYSVYKLTEQDVTLTLPFYTHFSLFHMFLVLGLMCVPITDYKRYITVVDYKSKYTKKAN